MNYDHFIDIKNMCCAEPIVLLTKRIKQMKSGDVVLAESNKFSLVKDIQAYCQMTRHELLQHQEDGDFFRFWIRVK